MSVEVDVWYVKLADGDVERVTLDQLDEAFQNGQIDENSMVLAAGTERWMKLSELLQASDAAPPQAAPAPSPSPAAQPAAPIPQVRAAQPAPTVRPPSPVAAQPLVTVPPPGTTNVPVASTLRPLSFDTGADDSDLEFPRSPSRKGRVLAAVATVAILGAAAFVVAKRSSIGASSDTSGPAFAAAVALPPAAPPPPAEPATPPSPAPMQASNNGPSSVMDPTRADSTHLSDAQKQKLLEADKKKTHEHAHGGGGGAVSHSAPVAKSKSSPTFTTSGNKYDPLNSTL